MGFKPPPSRGTFYFLYNTIVLRSTQQRQMFVLEFKAKVKPAQRLAINEAIRTAQFVRNKCLRYWMDNRGVGKYDLYKHNTELRAEYKFVKALNSHACQAAVERTWSSISRFFENCRKNISGKKGYPRFKKHSRSVEYKTSGWSLSDNRRWIKFTDKKNVGALKLIGTRDLNYYQIEQIKRVRIVRRADSYYVQMVLSLDSRDMVKPHPVTNKAIGIDVGLKYFYADCEGNTIAMPSYYRSSERQLNRANRKKSVKYRRGQPPTQPEPSSGAVTFPPFDGASFNGRNLVPPPGLGKQRGARSKKCRNEFRHAPLARKTGTRSGLLLSRRERKAGVHSAPQSNNYHKARIRYARKHLRVSRQREEYCKRVAYSVIQSNDLIAYEDLNVRGLVRNRHLAKSITDAGWSTFRRWLEYFGYKYGKVTVAVPPHNTSQNCSSCGKKVAKTLSTRTHICPHCNYVDDRDVNAARNILARALSTQGHWGTYASGDLPSWAVGAILPLNGESVNEESSTL